MTIEQTKNTLERYFNERVDFWGKKYDDSKAFKKALDDVGSLYNDPFSSQGKRLDRETKRIFIHYKEVDPTIQND